MNTAKPVCGMLSLLLMTILLVACGPTAQPTAAPTAIPPTAEPTAVPPTAASTAAVVGAFQPLAPAECAALQTAVATKLGVEAVLSEAPFQDYVDGSSGTGCLVTVTGTGADFEFVAVSADLWILLQEQGWAEDMMYAAGGPTGMASGFRKGAALCLASVGWTPAADANCPPDKPIGECDLEPEQKLFAITLHCAQKASSQ